MQSTRRTRAGPGSYVIGWNVSAATVVVDNTRSVVDVHLGDVAVAKSYYGTGWRQSVANGTVVVTHASLQQNITKHLIHVQRLVARQCLAAVKRGHNYVYIFDI